MALDTAQKRFSAMHIGIPFRSARPLPDGTLDQGDRQCTCFNYSGVLADAPVEPPPATDGPRLYLGRRLRRVTS